MVFGLFFSVPSNLMSCAELIASGTLKEKDIIQVYQYSFWYPYEHYDFYIGVENGVHMVIRVDKDTKGKCRIMKRTLEESVGGRPCKINNYKDGCAGWVVQADGLERAKKMLGEKWSYRPYNSCESFAMWCRYGRPLCGQWEKGKKDIFRWL